MYFILIVILSDSEEPVRWIVRHKYFLLSLRMASKTNSEIEIPNSEIHLHLFINIPQISPHFLIIQAIANYKVVFNFKAHIFKLINFIY